MIEIINSQLLIFSIQIILRSIFNQIPYFIQYYKTYDYSIFSKYIFF